MLNRISLLRLLTIFALSSLVLSNNVTEAVKSFIRNCNEAQSSGIHTIRLDEESRPFSVVCEQTTFGGGWTVVMKRENNQVDFFNRNVDEFKFGFGNMSNEFFLGLDQLNALTTDQPHMVAFFFKDFNDIQYISTYDIFEIRDETYHYTTGDMTYAHAGFGIGFTKNNVFCHSLSKIKCENNVPGWQFNPYAESQMYLKMNAADADD